MPWPPPMHREARPSPTPRRCISFISATTILAPVQPTGCPMEIPEPFTLVIDGSAPSSRMQAIAWEAKASFSSMSP